MARIELVHAECSRHCADEECPLTHSDSWRTTDGDHFNTREEALAADKLAHPEEYWI